MKKCSLFSVLVVAFLLSFAGMVQADLNDGLVAYYPFDGSANDESGNGNDCSISGALAYEYSIIGGTAGSFDGNDSYLILPPNSDFDFSTASFTFSAWIYINSDNETGQEHDNILTIGTEHYKSISFGRLSGDNWNDSYASLWNDGIPRNYKGYISVSTDGVTWEPVYTKADISNEAWHLLTATRSNNELKIFLDGQYQKTKLISGSIVLGNTTLKIGSHYLLSNNDYDFNGKIDDLRIYNRALSESEILCLYTNCEVHCSQAELNAQYQSGRQACINDPASCGIEVGGDYQETYNKGFADGQKTCNNPTQSENCAILESNFNITMPCIDVFGTQLPINLERFTYPSDPFGYYWKLNLQ